MLHVWSAASVVAVIDRTRYAHQHAPTRTWQLGFCAGVRESPASCDEGRGADVQSGRPLVARLWRGPDVPGASVDV